ncbi:MAG: hypothetical protein ACRC7N_10325 [Clostridium sp.]
MYKQNKVIKATVVTMISAGAVVAAIPVFGAAVGVAVGITVAAGYNAIYQCVEDKQEKIKASRAVVIKE